MTHQASGPVVRCTAGERGRLQSLRCDWLGWIGSVRVLLLHMHHPSIHPTCTNPSQRVPGASDGAGGPGGIPAACQRQPHRNLRIEQASSLSAFHQECCPVDLPSNLLLAWPYHAAAAASPPPVAHAHSSTLTTTADDGTVNADTSWKLIRSGVQLYNARLHGSCFLGTCRMHCQTHPPLAPPFPHASLLRRAGAADQP